jgi:hypothetical protein
MFVHLELDSRCEKQRRPHISLVQTILEAPVVVAAYSLYAFVEALIHLEAEGLVEASEWIGISGQPGSLLRFQ